MIDITGMKSGMLTALCVDKNAKSTPEKWICKCECGNIKSIRRDHILRGETVSCGCKHYKPIHGMAGTRIHRIWVAMRQRCNNPQAAKYDRYGGRGIKVCDEWEKDFNSFYKWAASNGYRDDLTIDRIDNNRGYSPDNCRWATEEEQMNNTSANHHIMVDGIKMTVTQAARKYNLDAKKLDMRIIRGWDFERAFEGKVSSGNNI